MIDERQVFERVMYGFVPPDDSLERLVRRRDRKRRNQRIAAGVVALALFAGAVIAIARPILFDRSLPATPQPTPRPHAAQSETFVLEEEPGIYVVDLRSGDAVPLPESITDVARPGWDESGYAASADGTQLLFMGEDQAGRPQVFVAGIDGSSVRQLTHEPDGAAGASWSPDGSTIVYVEAGADDPDDSTFGATLLAVDAVTGDTTVIRMGEEGDFQSPRFSPDGERIMFTRREGEIRTIRSDGRMETDPSGAHGGVGVESRLVVDGYDAVFAPDGTTIAFHRDVDVCLAMCHGATRESQIWLADADGGHPRPFGGVPTSAPRWSPDGTRIAFVRAIRSDGTIGGEPIGSTGPGSGSPVGGTVVFDPATGDFTTIVNAYALFGWLDDDAVVVQILDPSLL